MSGTHMPSIVIDLDGVQHTVQLHQSDYIRAEEDGVGQEQLQSEDNIAKMRGIARVAFHAVQRAKRRGLIEGEVPTQWDDFLDVFDLAPDEVQPEVDPEGKGSGQAPSTG